MNENLKFLAQSIGKFINYWGFKNIHGEIWTLLYLKNNPMSSLEIQKELDISKALLSQTINDLIEYKLVVFAGTIEHGRATYVANEKVFSVIQQVLEGRELLLIENVIKNIEKIESDSNTEQFDLKRLKKIKRMSILASKVIKSIATFRDFSFKSFIKF